MQMSIGTDRQTGPGASAAPPPEVAPSRWAWLAAAACAAAVALTLVHPQLKPIVDLPSEAALNRLAGLYPAFDYSLRILDRFSAFQGVALVALICGALVDAREARDAPRLVIGCFCASLAAALSRIVQLFLPLSPRPLYDPALHFHAPLGADVGALRDASSYPSDHATLLFGLACTLLVVRPRVGLLAIAWVVLLGVIRMYGGYHYLTDTIGGWLFGATIVFAGAALPLQRLDRPLAWAMRHRFLMAASLFFLGVEAADMFDDFRGAASFILRAVRGDPNLWM